MLEYPGARYDAFLRDVTYNDEARVDGLGLHGEARRHLLDLAHAPRQHRQFRVVNGLHGIEDDQAVALRRHCRQNVVEVVRCQEGKTGAEPEPFLPGCQLPEGFLTRNIEGLEPVSGQS